MLVLLLITMAALAGTIPVLELRGSVDPGSADYIVKGIEAAEASGAPAVVLTLDTPGGLLTSTRKIVQAELTAEVPVIVYVAPSGARAGSAGVFLTMAAHVAVMAPGTTIGAAHPVQLFGGGGGGEDAEEADPAMEEKILEDTMAWARAIAEQRGRSAEWAELAVRESDALTDGEAVELNVVDLVAPDLETLLRLVDGRVVETASGSVTLRTAGLIPDPVRMTFRQQVVHLLGDPNLLFILIVLGMLGLYTEFHNPGLIIPGVVGVLCLLGAAIGLSVIPFNAGGLLLLLFGFACFALEIYTPTFGALTAAGVIAVALGGVLLFEVTGFDLSISPWILGTVTLGAGATALMLAWLILRDRREKPATGAEGLVGMIGLVMVGGDGGGRVSVHGEDWAALWIGDLPEGRRVRVVRMDGLTLEVMLLGDDNDPRGGS
ncbi:MAG: nodulation protein NfeD [Deltaproteobacteria bacterium]|nr:nodulation protein NfeD [Deltaproteobacteria bacterium]